MITGVKPTGSLHIGNYFGAIRQLIHQSENFNTFVFIADLHAVTGVQNGDELRKNVLDIAIDYLAAGLDPKKVTMFVQSQVPQHAELAWIFNCITTMPYLMRAHAFKDAEAKNKEINVGVFDYPLLMAADILLYDADVVPVGNDQKQHVEIARDTAQKFNRTFGAVGGTSVEIFKAPEPLILADVGVVPGTDGQKMSKSYGNTIGLFASDEEIRSAVMRIPTDSKGVNDPKDPETCKVFALHKLFATPEELASLREKYLAQSGVGIGYKESKDLLVGYASRFIGPMRERRAKIAANPKKVLKLLEKGRKVATKIAESKMMTAKTAVGLN